MYIYVNILHTNITLSTRPVLFLQSAAHRDILVLLVISLVHPVPLANNVVEIVLWYVLSNNVTLFFDVHQSPLLYPKRTIQVWDNLIIYSLAFFRSSSKRFSD